MQIRKAKNKSGSFRCFVKVQQRARLRNIRLHTKVALRSTIKKEAWEANFEKIYGNKNGLKKWEGVKVNFALKLAM